MVSEYFCINMFVFIAIGRFEVAQLFQFGKNASRAPFNRLFICFNYEFRLLWLLIGIINARKSLEFPLISEPVQALYIALATDFDGALDIHFNKVSNLLACP